MFRSKLGHGLVSGEYSKPPRNDGTDDEKGVDEVSSKTMCTWCRFQAAFLKQFFQSIFYRTVTQSVVFSSPLMLSSIL